MLCSPLRLPLAAGTSQSPEISLSDLGAPFRYCAVYAWFFFSDFGVRRRKRKGREVEFCFGVMWFGLGLGLDLDLAEMGREHLD